MRNVIVALFGSMLHRPICELMLITAASYVNDGSPADGVRTIARACRRVGSHQRL